MAEDDVSRPGMTLAAVLLGFLTLPMLMSGTTVALPRIGADLDASGAALQWVVVGYFLAASSLMLVVGSLGDVLGRRRVFALGAALYTAGALAGALARDIWVLDVARTLSGVGAAGVMAVGGAILGATFTGAARNRAFAAMGTASGVGLAIGPALAGWLVGTVGWRATFACFAAAGALVWAGTLVMPRTRPAAGPGRIDLAGGIAFVAASAGVMFGVNQASRHGWGSPAVLVPVGAGAVALAVFVLVERRSARPVLELGLLGDRRFVGWVLGCAFVAAGPAGVMAFLPTYLQGVTGASAGQAGLTMLLMTVPVLLFPQAGARLVNRGLPGRVLIAGALLLIAAGHAWLTVLEPGIGTLALLGPLATIGTGMGLAMGTADAQAMDRVPADRLGMAAGLLNTARAGAGTLATTVFGTSLTLLLAARVGDAATAARITAGDLSGSGHRTDAALSSEAALFSEVWHVMSWTVAAGCAAVALAVWALLAPDRRSPEKTSSPQERRKARSQAA
ncbi:MFS transporter [Thermomonospora cellulosilytica]|uniref:MFS family permease n=1 Tax=Thermomonospora cellulosilytica TaxID=1411118 RepID=A0A7W3MT46_9ACTN|nr:MFS transporter [Thermomonospora cellulosilytica]MBA9001389.1 MFS family permease [Thermomonospora cellulosilytica]